MELEVGISNTLGKLLKEGKLDENATISIKVPVLNKTGKSVMLPTEVMMKIDQEKQSMKVATWYISDSAFRMGGLK